MLFIFFGIIPFIIKIFISILFQMIKKHFSLEKNNNILHASL